MDVRTVARWGIASVFFALAALCVGANWFLHAKAKGSGASKTPSMVPLLAPTLAFVGGVVAPGMWPMLAPLGVLVVDVGSYVLFTRRGLRSLRR